MTEKVGLIKNPLTIIAIFAGIAEVSGTVVLPFIADNNQRLFISFLIFFPSILVILFFITLNFNNKVLYAPSDYSDESNYIKINRYDFSKQKNVEVIVPKEKSESEELLRLTEKLNLLSSQVFEILKPSQNTEENVALEEYIETIGYNLRVTNFENSNAFVNYMSKFGFNFEVYSSPGGEDKLNDFPRHRAIWLGKNLSLDAAKSIIKHSKKFYPHLKYILVDDDQNDQFSIYIGGSTESAVKIFKLIPLKDADFEKLEEFQNIEEFHTFIREFRK